MARRSKLSRPSARFRSCRDEDEMDMVVKEGVEVAEEADEDAEW